MALINCPECNKEVSNSAKTCPHCGFELIVPIKNKPYSTEIKSKKSNGCIGLLILGVLIFIIIAIIFSTKESSPTDNKTTQPNKFLAYNYAEDFVKQNLKAPSTAKFPGVM
ncbi:MAG: zinc ribbon domain-containing protein [Bacteroidota bacterium]